MLLNIFSDLKNIITELFSKFSWANVFVLLTGMVVGFVMCAIIYLVLVLISLKKNDKYVHKSEMTITDEELKRIIISARNQYYEESANLPTNRKFVDIKNISWQLINDIAKKYYPNSDYPIYELSVDELMMLNHYITNRVDSLFKGKILKPFKRIKMSQILKLIDIKKRIDDSKVMKAANKAKIPNLVKATMTVLNVFNPAYWVKKLMIETTLSIGTNKIASTIIDIVGEETAKIYSKNVFNQEKTIDSDVEQTIKELESGLEN